jgi:AraC-like DNA-binding protein
LDMFVRGIAVGAMIVLGLGALRSNVSRDQRIALILASASISLWLITESGTLWSAFGRLQILSLAAVPVGAFFWLLVVTTLADRRLTPLMLAPAAVQTALGLLRGYLPAPLDDWSWWAVNAIAGVLALHACWVIARGWSGDLMESRRQVRGLILGAGAIFAATNVVFAFAARFDPTRPWLLISGGHLYGVAFIAPVIVATTVMSMQMRPAIFGAPRRNAAGPDPRVEAAERQMLARLNELMAADGWRQEGLAIGEVARRLDAPEHRVRRLINQRLGFRNFADFVNSYRIEAARRRLADPAEARTTVAAIAFDLGYGSLGPFNRAFRAATGSTPTEWRRQALQASPDLQEAG